MLKPVDRYRLWVFLRHGDDDHKQWLKDAIEAFFLGKERPPPK